MLVVMVLACCWWKLMLKWGILNIRGCAGRLPTSSAAPRTSQASGEERAQGARPRASTLSAARVA